MTATEGGLVTCGSCALFRRKFASDTLGICLEVTEWLDDGLFWVESTDEACRGYIERGSDDRDR